MRATRTWRHRATRRVVVAVVGPVMLLSALAGPAHADSAAAVTRVTTDATGHVDVGIDTGSDADAVLWVQVSVLASTDADAAVLAGTDAGTSTASAEGGQHTFDWRSDDPLRLTTDVARGQYPVAVDFRMRTGIVQHWRSTGTPFDDRLRTSVTAADVDRQQLDFDHRTATVTGSVSAYDPATGTTGAAPAGLTVALDDPVQGQLTQGSTDADGGFSIAVTPTTTVRPRVTVIDVPASVDHAGDAYLPGITVTLEPVRILGRPASTRVHAGASVELHGSAQRLSTDGWVPLANADVMTASSQYSSNTSVPTALAHAATTSGGEYTYRVTAHRTATLFTYARPTTYLTPFNALESDVHVPVTGRYSGSFALDQFATASFRGRIAGPCAAQAVVLQYSGNGRSGWRSIASARAALVDGNRCTVSITGAGHAHGYYRVTSAESDNLLAYTGRAKYLARTTTRITSWRLAPRRPSVNGRITSTGSLQQLRGSSWGALRNGLVSLVWRPRGDTTYYLMASAHTSSTGRFSLSAKVYGDGTWAMVYRPDSTHLYSETAVHYVDAR